MNPKNDKKTTKPAELAKTTSAASAELTPAQAEKLNQAKSIQLARAEIDRADEAEGFERITPADGLRIFWAPEVGKSMQGVLLGRFEKTGDQAVDSDGVQQYYYQVQLTQPYDECRVYLDPNEPIPYTAEAGETIIVDERWAFRAIAPVYERMTKEGIKIEILVRPLGKSRTRKGRKIWNFDVKGRLLDQKRKPLMLARASANGDTKQLPAG